MMAPRTLGSLVDSSHTALQPLGRALVAAIHSAAQAMRLYPFENVVVQNALEELHRAARRILDREGALELNRSGDFLFLNDTRLRFDLASYVSFSFVGSALAKHGIGVVTVERDVESTEWAPLLSVLLGDAGTDPADAYDRAADRLEAAGVRHIGVLPPRDRPAGPDADDQARLAARRTYAQSVHAAREVLTSVNLRKAVNVRRVKRAVQSIVDQVLTNETSMLSMTTLRDYDEYTFTHSVNVCIFSVVIGQRLGLSRIQLYELGLGALLHDIGKMRISRAITNKAGPLTDDETELMRQHPIEGMIALFSLHGIGEVPYRAMLIAYEHHMKVDLSGYPRNRRPRAPTLFSRIVAVADGFDAATSRRSYQSMPWQPDAVFREMRDNPARGFDPLVVKAFINVTGIYPIGTLVILDTYELAVVVAPNQDPAKLHQPVVRIITDGMGNTLATPVTVDLAEIDPATGKPSRNIIKTTDPERYGINVAAYVT